MKKRSEKKDDVKSKERIRRRGVTGVERLAFIREEINGMVRCGSYTECVVDICRAMSACLPIS